MPHVCRVAVAGLLVAAIGGCKTQQQQPVKLEGKVTLDGKPLANAPIAFYPADKDGASPVFEKVVGGRFSAAVVPQGKYRVAFRSTVAPEGYGQANEPVDSGFGAPKPGRKKDPLPEKYRDPSFPVDATADNLN